MIKRIVDVSNPSYVRLENGQLKIEQSGRLVSTMTVEDLGVLILQHSGIVITQAALVACQQNNAVVVLCDDRHLPYSILLPISEGNTLHTKELKIQMGAKKSAHKRLWKQTVVHKINQQAVLLEELGKNPNPVKRIAGLVKSNDKENHEAQAAQKYWRLLFGESFRRNSDLPGINSLLNYGYAIVRAVTARAIVGSGLHPALGIHHSNQYNGLCLADDLMEPLRPWVDREVYRILEDNPDAEINKQTKASLLGLLSQSASWKTRVMPLMVSMHYLVADFKRALVDSSVKLQFPKWQAVE